MAKIIRAPSKLDYVGMSVFLAGSIEMGKAENWQERLERELADIDGTILNPRRLDWDSSWEQSITNPKFVEQVDWELEALERAAFIAMYFDPSTKSPISLLELGLFGYNDDRFRANRKLVVCCPDGFWRKGNVDIVCQRYGIGQVETIEELIAVVKYRLQVG